MANFRIYAILNRLPFLIFYLVSPNALVAEQNFLNLSADQMSVISDQEFVASGNVTFQQRLYIKSRQPKIR